MSLRSLASAAALGLLLTGCASYNLSSDQRAAAPAAASPHASAPAAAFDVSVEGSGALPPGAVLTLSLFDPADQGAVTLYSQDVKSAPAALPWTTRFEVPGGLVAEGRNLALGAVVKNAAGLPVYGTETPGVVTAGASAVRIQTISTGL